MADLDAEDLAELEMMKEGMAGQVLPPGAAGGIMGGAGPQAIPPMVTPGPPPQGNPGAPAIPPVPPVPSKQAAQDLAAERKAILEDKRTASRGEVEKFISDNRLDDNAAEIFRKEPSDLQAHVIDRGTLAGCKNPSAALFGRLRDARQLRFTPVSQARAAVPSLGPGQVSVAQDVEDFIEQNKVDLGAARALRAEPPDVQQGVMDRGTLTGFQNPSALIIARIRDVKAVRAEAKSRGGTPGMMGSGGSAGQSTRKLTREDLRRAVEARKAGKGGSTSAALLKPDRKPSRSRSHRRGRSRSGGRGRSRSGGRGGGGGRSRSRSRSRSRGRGGR